MDYYDNVRRCQTLDELFQIWRNKEKGEVHISAEKMESTMTIDHKNDGFVADGIINPKIWHDDNHKKILFVLKEAYGGGDWNLALALLQKHWADRLWGRIARWTYGLQHTTNNHIEKYRKNLSPDEHNMALEQIAVMNLKKSKGKSQSDYGIINAYAMFDKEELRKEFELIDADIIVCGYTFYALYNLVYENAELINYNDNCYFFLDLGGRRRLFLSYYHPANRWPDLINYYGLVGIYQQALLEEANIKNGEVS